MDDLSLVTQILKLRGKGVTDSEIARQLGTSRQRIGQLAPRADNGREWTSAEIFELRVQLAEKLDLGDILPQDDLAQMLNCRLMSVSRWERGIVRPSWRSRFALDKLVEKHQINLDKVVV